MQAMVSQMKIPKLIRKLSGLYKLAVGQAGKPEGENARRQMDKMLENSSVRAITNWYNGIIDLVWR